MATRWVCPHCDHAVILDLKQSVLNIYASCRLDSADGDLSTNVNYISCPNPACKKITLNITYGPAWFDPRGSFTGWRAGGTRLRLLPPSYARPIPDYVPAPIRADYVEACSIIDLSPKAAATLSRRALQGIVRDFHGIVRATLNKELEDLRPLIDPTVWQAIDTVRSVGNIGAHMEKDINVIVDVDPDEALRLIRLIELLIREWYVARYRREEDLKALIALGAAKQEERKAPGASDAANPTETPQP